MSNLRAILIANKLKAEGGGKIQKEPKLLGLAPSHIFRILEVFKKSLNYYKKY
jgi:hypothetical protein